MSDKIMNCKKFDGLLYVNARGLKAIHNAFIILWLFVTKRNRPGHWYFAAGRDAYPPFLRWMQPESE